MGVPDGPNPFFPPHPQQCRPEQAQRAEGPVSQNPIPPPHHRIMMPYGMAFLRNAGTVEDAGPYTFHRSASPTVRWMEKHCEAASLRSNFTASATSLRSNFTARSALEYGSFGALRLLRTTGDAESICLFDDRFHFRKFTEQELR